ncbi:hypothetical protein H0O03_01620 [Candidatus Micrarchaeota archaeon]|nr:hypothetical protein [Candidatus Micrarchaeota archaeon]
MAVHSAFARLLKEIGFSLAEEKAALVYSLQPPARIAREEGKLKVTESSTDERKPWVDAAAYLVNEVPKNASLSETARKLFAEHDRLRGKKPLEGWEATKRAALAMPDPETFAEALKHSSTPAGVRGKVKTIIEKGASPSVALALAEAYPQKTGKELAQELRTLEQSGAKTRQQLPYSAFNAAVELAKSYGRKLPFHPLRLAINYAYAGEKLPLLAKTLSAASPGIQLQLIREVLQQRYADLSEEKLRAHLQHNPLGSKPIEVEKMQEREPHVDLPPVVIKHDNKSGILPVFYAGPPSRREKHKAVADSFQHRLVTLPLGAEKRLNGVLTDLNRTKPGLEGLGTLSYSLEADEGKKGAVKVHWNQNNLEHGQTLIIANIMKFPKALHQKWRRAYRHVDKLQLAALQHIYADREIIVPTKEHVAELYGSYPQRLAKAYDDAARELGFRKENRLYEIDGVKHGEAWVWRPEYGLPLRLPALEKRLSKIRER